MKTVARAAEVVCWFDSQGNIHPVKLKTNKSDGTETTIKINRIVDRELEKLAGNPMMIFTCRGEVDGVDRPLELKYELGTCKWMLFKI